MPIANQHELTAAERFGILPLFALAGVALVLYGLHIIRGRRTRRSPVCRLLTGKDEWTGQAAVRIGVVWCVLGGLLVLMVVVMIIAGRTLLPK